MTLGQLTAGDEPDIVVGALRAEVDASAQVITGLLEVAGALVGEPQDRLARRLQERIRCIAADLCQLSAALQGLGETAGPGERLADHEVRRAPLAQVPCGPIGL